MPSFGCHSAYLANPFLRRHIVSGPQSWHGLMGRMEATLANPVISQPRLPPRRALFHINDFVQIQRDMSTGQQRIARGSIGIVTVVHENHRLLDVIFPACEPVTMTITIAAYELKPATAMAS